MGELESILEYVNRETFLEESDYDLDEGFIEEVDLEWPSETFEGLLD